MPRNGALGRVRLAGWCRGSSQRAWTLVLLVDCAGLTVLFVAGQGYVGAKDKDALREVALFVRPPARSAAQSGLATGPVS